MLVVGDSYRTSLPAVRATMQTRLASLLACLLLAHTVLAARKAPELSTWLKKGNDVDGRASNSTACRPACNTGTTGAIASPFVPFLAGDVWAVLIAGSAGKSQGCFAALHCLASLLARQKVGWLKNSKLSWYTRALHYCRVWQLSASGRCCTRE